MTDILANVELMFKDPPLNGRRVGITLSMDEIACDGRLCYLCETEDISGLCEHSAEHLSLTKMGTGTVYIEKVVASSMVEVYHEGKMRETYGSYLSVLVSSAVGGEDGL